MSKIPSIEENPSGFHKRYKVIKESGEQVDEDAEYIVLRLDWGGDDKEHIKAGRVGAIAYANAVAHHLPEVAKDLILRYSGPSTPPLTEERGEVPEDVEEIVAELWDNEKMPGHGLGGAFRLGVLAMYRRMKEQQIQLLSTLIIDQAKELSALQSQLSEAQHDRDLYMEWNQKSEKTVVALTDQLAVKVAALEQIVKDSQHIKSNPNCGYILKLAEDALK